ncbi:MAG: mechanosensitive ion channel [Clostridiales bacterium]|nr:mechanosensitive ion channel [Clostridiales bacterium]
MFDIIKDFLIKKGLESSLAEVLSVLSLIILSLITGFALYFIAKRIILKFFAVIAKKSKTKWDDAVVNNKVFNRLALIIPALVLNWFAPSFPSGREWIRRITYSFIIFCVVLAFDKFLNAVNDIYRKYEISKTRPIKGYLQIIKIFVYIVACVIIISVLMDRSPLILLGGIGAATAVLLLIFQNSILGFVAGIQLTENDMVRIGDWIEMPSRNADGDVIDITLHTVKVKNWDKTITTIPTHALISESFKNWRGMSETGGRRIKRCVYIDMTSIRFCNDEMLERFKKIRYIEDYINGKIDEISEYNKALGVDDNSSVVNGRHLTNIGTFRAYVTAYLKNHPKIHKELISMVRQLAPADKGIPVEIYCFTSTTAWVDYESIQSDVFDHILAVVPEFDLRIYQGPSGHDLSDAVTAIQNKKDFG